MLGSSPMVFRIRSGATTNLQQYSSSNLLFFLRVFCVALEDGVPTCS